MKQQDKPQSLISEKYRTPKVTKEDIERIRKKSWLKQMKAIERVYESMVEWPMPEQMPKKKV